ncbi:hypothetical protein [Streptosporangium sp. NPDC000396]|uniref:hypothetical protein n=1 Tax=Streptosporangium sp. NPDC000396 TaxID=3366185 RepID=UPI0036ABFAC3
MNRSMSLTIAAVVALLSGGCGTAAPAGPSSDPERALLEPAALGSGWHTARTVSGEWDRLRDVPAPCGRRVIIPQKALTHVREFTTGGGTSVTQFVIVDVDAVDAFKRFYAECDAVGEVAGLPGPQHVARHGLVEVATPAGDALVIVTGTVPEAELRRVAETGRDRVERLG